MSITFTRTREQIRNMVLGKLTVLDPGETPSAADSTRVYEAMDLRLKEMPYMVGMLWRTVNVVPLSFNVSAGVATASATTAVLFPVALHIVDNSQDEPVEIITAVQYAEIFDKTETGTPTKAMWEDGTSPQHFRFWPVPDRNTTAKLTYQAIPTDTTASAAPDISVAMMRAFSVIVAYDLADDFGLPEGKIQRLKAECKDAEKMLRKINAPRISYAAVAVDDWGNRNKNDFYKDTDYER